ncbi:HEAT repeat domain-containing protein [Nostoc sp. FACHB-152]|uniref:HEAT repeat domain-containing protein n=1 Tax=unclassified Nostoc TaxID=2593658 RepID=UPI001682FFE5|nr:MULTISPECIES: HEAT repeat domain-containing protein [unclassified Nostoc]MBD2446620.1 HEAT repeat domain-containing protein [Nostoc sp. FACHB-152]MBD2466468.1 HEAT repeat domain-containing protein [Nostoc sp. FACHB-145]
MQGNINPLLVQAQTAHDAADWSSLIQYLQQLILVEDNQYSKNILELALSVLEMGDFQQRWEITKVLVRLGNIAITPLIEILADEDAEEELHWYAARTLGELQHPDAIAPLVELLRKSEDEELKAIAATALGQMGSLAITELSQLLKQDDTRLLAVRSLAYIRTPETITPLLSVVQDAEVAVRATAIEALSSFHDQRVPPVLLKALNDVVPTVRRVAVLGLSSRPDLCAELNLLARLQPMLYDFNIEVCSAAAVALSRLGGDNTTHHLFTVLMSPHTPITLQLEIIRALVWVGTLSGLEYLQQAFAQNKSEILCQEIVTVLGRVEKLELVTKATEILLELLQTQHPATEIVTIKSAIALSLGQLGNQQAITPLTILTQDPHEQVRLHAIAALKKLSPEVVHQQ